MENLVLHTAADVAKILKASEATIWNWQYGRKKSPIGFPPGVKMGASLRWRSCDIQRFIAGLPFTTTGRIPTLANVENVAASVLEKPVRGRGRPRKVQTSTIA